MIGAARWLYNQMLDYRNEAWLAAKAAGATGIHANLGYLHLCGVLTQMKVEHPWLKQVSTEALRGSLRSLDRAFANFFAGTGAYPVFKKRGQREGLTFGNGTTIAVDGDMVKLPTLGWMKMRLHRPLDGAVRTAAVSYEDGKWYVSFAVAGEFTLPNKGEAGVGIDLGIAQAVTTSTGEVIQFPVETVKEARRLRFFQRQAARRKKGSARRRRSLARVAKLRAKQARRRADAAHKLSHRLATTHAVIAIEDLKLRSMTASAKGTVTTPGKNVRAKAGLNRELLARGHAEFRRMLTYKCERSGAKLVAVPPHHTSQRCSSCGHVAPENRETQAEFECVQCGHTQNADHNAALNILAAGWAVIAQGGDVRRPKGRSPGELRTDKRKTLRRAA